MADKPYDNRWEGTQEEVEQEIRDLVDAVEQAQLFPTLLDEFRQFQREWDAAQRAEAARTQAQAIRDHWQGRTPPTQVPLLVHAYLAQQERERQAMKPEVAEAWEHPGRYNGSHEAEWSPAQGKAYREAELARKAREEARERRPIVPGGERGPGY